MPTPFFTNPEEAMKHMQEQHERMEAEADAYRHAVESMFSELSLEHLTTMRQMLHSIAMNEPEDSVKLACYYEGVAATTLSLKHGVCGGCGQNHDEVLKNFNEANNKPEPKEPKAAEQETRPQELNPDDLQKMEDYNLDDLRDEDTLQLLGFICKNCKMKYPSIEDRMLRPPGVEGCTGCIQKTKWG